MKKWSVLKNGEAINWLSIFVILFIIFYVCTFFSVSEFKPSSIPTHHDDYANYSQQWYGFKYLLAVRPLSTAAIQGLCEMGPEWLIWSVRLLTVFYVFLIWKLFCRLFSFKYQWLFLLGYGLAVFSTPIAVDYAHYTGMITHLMSGCFAIVAAILMFHANDKAKISTAAWSGIFVIFSVLSKEDYLLFYILFYAYFLYRFRPVRFRFMALPAIGIILSVLMVVAAKMFTSTAFLGSSDQSASYYMSTSVFSIIKVVLSYLGGGGHPAMRMHGRMVLGVFFLSAFAGMFMLKSGKYLGFFLLAAALSLIAPYSVLPNHISAYYEIIWLPFIYLSFIVSIHEMFTYSRQTYNDIIVACLFAAGVAVIIFVDYPGRKSIAGWYDAIHRSNRKNFENIYKMSSQINNAPSVCVYGADEYSPWLKQDARYLENVMNLKTHWIVWIKQDDPHISDFMVSAEASRGKIEIRYIGKDEPVDCLAFNWGSGGEK